MIGNGPKGPMAKRAQIGRPLARSLLVWPRFGYIRTLGIVNFGFNNCIFKILSWYWVTVWVFNMGLS